MDRGKALLADKHVRIELLRSAVAARPGSADLLFQLADALAGIGDHDEFARIFRQAYLLAPSVRPRLDTDATKLLSDRVHKLRTDAHALLDRGVYFAPVIAALATAESLLGNAGEVARLVNYQRFLQCDHIHPAGEADDAAFRAELTRELISDATYLEKQKGKAGAGRYRFDVLDAQTPTCRLMAAELRRQVDRYIAALKSSTNHPFVTSCPACYVLRGWSVATSGDDHFDPHIHPQAWLSGAYYLAQPDVSRDAHDNRGWLHVGPPTQFGVTTGQGWEERFVEPVPGRLVLMPGYFYHGTRPTLSEEMRVCVAFDVVPEELDAHRG
jgi:hypothetical protein